MLIALVPYNKGVQIHHLGKTFLCGFSLTLAFFHSPNTCGLIGYPKLPVGANGCLSLCWPCNRLETPL